MSKSTFEPGTVLSAKSYKRTQWKNGGGESAEIAIFPEGLDFSKDPFLWRLSSAQISQEGPFSQFHGFDRLLTLIEGEALSLQIGNSRKSLSPGEVLQFSGDTETTAFLPKGAVRDLGLIFNRKTIKASFQVIQIGSKPRSFSTKSSLVLLVNLIGSARISIYPNEAQYSLPHGDTLQLNLKASPQVEHLILIEPKTPTCNLAWIDLEITR